MELKDLIKQDLFFKVTNLNTSYISFRTKAHIII